MPLYEQKGKTYVKRTGQVMENVFLATFAAG